MLQVAAFRALAEHVAGRVHPSAAADPAAKNRHRAFILTHVSVGALPFAALPALLAVGAAPGGLGLAAFGWLAGPIIIALHLSGSGRLDRAHALSAVLFSAMVFVLAATTGGVWSPALALLALPVVDAALSGSRAGVKSAILAAAATVSGLVAAALAGSAHLAADQPAVAIVGIGAASIYLVALGVRAFAMAEAVERAGRPSADRFETFSGSVDDLVTRHAANGAVVFASAAARALLDAAPRELADQGLFARIHIADRPAFLHGLASAIGRNETAAVELRVRCEAGRAPTFRWVEMRARGVRPHEADEASAAFAPVVATFRDVSAAKAHEAELVAAREEADRANVAKTRFLAHMSHELRTPLNAIIGFSEILSDESLCRLTPERRADYAALIHRSGAHLLEVVNSILDMARIESGAFSIAPRACPLRPLAEHVVNLMALKAEGAGVELRLEPSVDIVEVDADPRAVTQVLLNLVGNALKFTPRGGDVAIGFSAKSAGVVMSVRDNGVGIAPEHLGRLGEAFYQADPGHGRQNDGAGLGLSVVRGLVALHGGEVAVDSTLGRGTVVSVFLPHAARVPEPIGSRVEAAA